VLRFVHCGRPPKRLLGAAIATENYKWPVFRSRRKPARNVAHAAPDGYTVFFAAAPQITVVPHVQKVNYDPLKDFTPVTVFGTGPFILAINGAIPAKTIQEFVEYASARQISYGSGGFGSIGHLSGALFMACAGVSAVHVPYVVARRLPFGTARR
jgi:tripartite-type tricarboxylate transporter receptor subunit TctC